MYGTYQFFTTVKPAEIAARLEVVADRNGNKLTVSPEDGYVLIQCAVTWGTNVNDGEDVIILCKQYHVKNRYLVKFDRIKGSAAGYQLSIDGIYNSYEIMEVMDLK
eukprot:371995_1